jgi:neutral trehalase
MYHIRLKISGGSLCSLLKGGITGSTKASIAGIPEDVPQRQWDYPYWAPHQMLLWKGLINYGEGARKRQ